MKVGKIIRVTLISLLTTALAAYIVYSVFFLSQPDENEKCASVEIIVDSENDQAAFVDKTELENILKDAHIYPKGMLMINISTKKIEDAIKGKEFISKIECYKAPKGKVCINVEQRIPIIYVLPNGQDGFFVDAQGHVIHNRGYVSNLVVASGDVDEAYASKELIDLARFLQKDSFWNNQIEQIYVMRGRKNERVIEIIPRVGNQVIYLGNISNFEKKLHNLRIFYDKAIGTVGWNKYARVNLEYENQIICTKRK